MLEALKDKDFHLTNEKKLDEKVKTFQTKCQQLEGKLQKTNEEKELDLKKLMRENAYLTDKNLSLQKSYDDLMKEYESVVFNNKAELQKILRGNESQIEELTKVNKELLQKVQNLQTQKNGVEAELRSSFSQLDQLSTKLEERNVQMKKKQLELEDLEDKNVQYMRKIDDLNGQILKMKKKS